MYRPGRGGGTWGCRSGRPLIVGAVPSPLFLRLGPGPREGSSAQEAAGCKSFVRSFYAREGRKDSAARSQGVGRRVGVGVAPRSRPGTRAPPMAVGDKGPGRRRPQGRRPHGRRREAEAAQPQESKAPSA